jgi:hypothetical protein
MTASISIYQIFYDEETRSRIEPGYLPLDNTANPRPDWYEFWSIRQFLRENPLQPDRWYGFFSPRFGDKTKLSPAEIFEFIETIEGYADVALFSPYWDQIAYFQNPFEQGEYYHPGLMAAARRFIDIVGVKLDLDRLVSDTLTAVFSNYVVAKPAFWAAWLKLADLLFEFAEHSDDPAAIAMRTPIRYKGEPEAVAMKVFIQERLASMVLALGGHRAASVDTSDRRRPAGLLTPRILRSLQTCDLLKQEFRRTGDRTFLDAYRKLRATIPMRRPSVAAVQMPQPATLAN